MTMALACPQCGSRKQVVIDKRDNLAGNSTCRRRKCLKCTYRWSTYETSATDRCEQEAENYAVIARRARLITRACKTIIKRAQEAP